MNYTVEEIAGILGAGLRGRAAARVRAVTNDSRQARSGSLFVALPGERADGHDFVDDAFRRGAAAALVRADRQVEPSGDGVLIAVDDPLTALYDLARKHGATVGAAAHGAAAGGAAVRVAVTGSSGKTTTKEILGSILRRHGRSLVSEASFNAEIGLPLSVLRLTGGERYAVFEVGINSVGEMERYAALARPDHAVITNVGSAHVGRIGSRREIAQEKGALLRAVAPSGRVYVREREPEEERLLAGVRARVVRFGTDSTAGYEGSENRGLDGWVINWEGLRIRFALPGRHNLDNALAALAVAAELRCDPRAVAAGVEAVRPAPGRLCVHRGRCTVIHDGYNANPESVRAALTVLRGAETPTPDRQASGRLTGRRVAVLGPMLELGRYGPRAHLDLVTPLIHAGIDLLCCFGAATRPLCRAFAAAAGGKGSGGGDASGGDASGGAADRAIWTETLEEIDGRLRAAVRDGDVVLLKASRAFRIERLLPAAGAGADAGA